MPRETRPSSSASGPRPLQAQDDYAPDEADLALVDRISRGEGAAWSELIHRYQDRLFAVCFRMVRHRELAADLTQDSFVKIIQGLHTYDRRSKLSTWMIRVTMNVCLSRIRSEKLRAHASLEGMASPAGVQTGADLFAQETEPSPAEGVEGNEDTERVLASLSELDPDQRAILVLCDCRGLPYEQIAEILGIAIGTVKSRLFRARAALRDAVESKERTNGTPSMKAKRP